MIYDDMRFARENIFNMTVLEFATILGVKKSTVRSWENGFRKPSKPVLLLMYVYIKSNNSLEMIEIGKTFSNLITLAKEQKNENR